MILTHEHYVPSLRWRMSEYQALMRLKSQVKDQIMPLICLPDIEFDFETRQPRKTVNDYILPFPAKFLAKWPSRPAWVTLSKKIAMGRLNNGTHCFDYIFDNLRPNDAHAIPAIPLSVDTETVAAASRAITQDRKGMGIILRLVDLMTPGMKDRVDELTASMGLAFDETDLFIDLGAPNFRPYATFAKALITALLPMGDMSLFRNLVLISTAIPRTFSDIAKGTDQILRHDWLFYNTLCATLPMDMRRPVYGDYTIVHPDFVALDMRMIRPTGKVIYTMTEAWGTRKGGAFRGNEIQMHEHCQAIIGTPSFAFQGSDFSYGDNFIEKCANREVGASNLTRWKEVGINHHITTVVNDLATLSAAP